jgi:hypothetical protein
MVQYSQLQCINKQKCKLVFIDIRSTITYVFYINELWVNIALELMHVPHLVTYQELYMHVRWLSMP